MYPRSLNIILFLAVLSLLLVPGGCTSESSETETANGRSTSETSAGEENTGEGEENAVRIGISIPAATHGWPAGVGWWAQETMKQYPDVQWEFQRAANGAEQVSQIQAMLQKDIDGLVVLPFDSSTPLRAIESAKEQGVFVVSVDRGLQEPIADIYVAGDNRAFGRKSAEFMVEALGRTGNIVILRGMQTEIDTERYEGAMEVFNQHENIKVLDAQHGNWNQAEAYTVMKNFLTKYDDIDAVWASDDDMALGVEKAIMEAGREGEMWILGGAGMNDIVKRVMEHDHMFPADITYPPGMIAAGIHLAVGNLRDRNELAVFDEIPPHLGVPESDLLDGPHTGDQQRNITLEVHLITPENAADYYFPDSVY